MKIKHYSIALDTLTDEQIDTIWQWHRDNGGNLCCRDVYPEYDNYLDFDDEGLGFIELGRSDTITYEEWCELAGVKVEVNNNPMPEIKAGMVVQLNDRKIYAVADCGWGLCLYSKHDWWELCEHMDRVVSIGGHQAQANCILTGHTQTKVNEIIWQKQSPEQMKLAELKSKREDLDKEIKEL